MKVDPQYQRCRKTPQSEFSAYATSSTRPCCTWRTHPRPPPLRDVGIIASSTRLHHVHGIALYRDNGEDGDKNEK